MQSLFSRRGRCLGTTALIGALFGSAGFAGSALAVNDCGVAAPGTTVICNAANEVDSYQNADGISYQVVDLTIVHPGDGVAPTEFISSGGAGNFGTLIINSTGPVSQTAVSAAAAQAGILAYSQNGAVTITTSGAGTVTTASDGKQGIIGRSQGAGAAGVVTVTAGAAVTTLGASSSGVVAVSDGAGGNVSVSATSVATSGASANGIVATTTGLGANGAASVTASGQVSTQGDFAGGVIAQGGGNVTISTQGVSTVGNNAHSIVGQSSLPGATGTVQITANGAVTTQGGSAFGIVAQATGGAITVNAQDVSTQGANGQGIIVQQTTAAGAAATVTARNVTTVGDGGIGVLVQSTGAVDLELNRVGTGGIGAFGVVVQNSGAALTEVLVHDGITTAGTNAQGLVIQANGTGDVDATVEGAIVTAGASAFGVNVSSAAGGDVTLDLGEVTTTGADAFGVAVVMSGGVADVTVNGEVRTTDAGVRVQNNGATAADTSVVRILGNVTTSEASAFGILLQNNGGAATLEAQDVTTTGDNAIAIVLQNTGAGATATASLTQNGTIRTSGAGASGAIVTAVAGAVSVDVGSIFTSGENTFALQAFSTQQSATVAVTDAQGGWGAGSAGIGFGSQTAAIASTLTVRAGGSVGALTDIAIVGAVGDETVQIAGHVVGAVNLAAGADAVRVQAGGRLDLRNFTDSDGDGVRDTEGAFAFIDLGAGADVLTLQAQGSLGLATVGASDIGQVFVEQFDNSGFITLQDQETGGSTPLGDDRLVQNGNYTGLGAGALHLDARLDSGGPGAQLTDRFLVNGNGSGSTRVSIDNIVGQGAATGTGNTAGISIAQVSNIAAGDTFVLAGPEIAGAFRYDIVAFDPASSSALEKDALLAAGDFWDYRLQSEFYDGVFEYAALLQGANLLGQSALQAALERPREPAPIAAPAQSAALGAGDVQEAVRPTAGDGVATGMWVAGFGEQLNVSPDGGGDFVQDNYGLQSGLDVFGWKGLFGGDDRMVLGVMGTMAHGKVSFDGSESNADISLWGGGFYAGYASGGLNINLVAQLLTGGVDFTAPLPGVDSELDLTTLGLGLGISHRFGFGKVFIEPGAELRYVHSWTEDGFQDANDADIGLDDNDSLIARSHLKAGVMFANVAPYLSAGVVHEFLGETGATASGLGFDTSTQGTTFELGGGITAWALASNLTLTLDGAYRFGDTVEGARVTGGIKFSW